MKITRLNGKINYFDWAIFNSKLFVYQRERARESRAASNPSQVKWFGFRTPLMRAVLQHEAAGRVEHIPKAGMGIREPNVS
jgi:hypothetical protein